MPRHYIGFTESGPQVFRNVRKDATGEPLIFLDDDEQRSVTLDFTAYLQSGETISSATKTDHSVTSTIANTTTTVTLTLTNAQLNMDARVTVVVTLSSGAKWRGNIRVRQTNRYQDERYPIDYGWTR